MTKHFQEGESRTILTHYLPWKLRKYDVRDVQLLQSTTA